MHNRRALITEIKGHSLDDGPGIRSVIFFKGCPLACTWCHNPESIEPRPTLSYNKSACHHFEDCIPVCETQAINPHNLFFIDRDRCTGCGKCVEVCASKAITLVGKQMTVDEVIEQIKPYKPFFDNSGGGVTLSGGEATLYLDFCEALLIALAALHIHVTLETSGFFHQAHFLKKMYPYLDQIYFDIKLIDSALHQKHCGQKNKHILENFRTLKERSANNGVALLARVPLIPKVTATKENLSAIAEFLTTQGEKQVALLPYNPLWHEKAQHIGLTYGQVNDSWMSESALAQCKKYFKGFTLV